MTDERQKGKPRLELGFDSRLFENAIGRVSRHDLSIDHHWFAVRLRPNLMVAFAGALTLPAVVAQDRFDLLCIALDQEESGRDVEHALVMGNHSDSMWPGQSPGVDQFVTMDLEQVGQH